MLRQGEPVFDEVGDEGQNVPILLVAQLGWGEDVIFHPKILLRGLYARDEALKLQNNSHGLWTASGHIPGGIELRAE